MTEGLLLALKIIATILTIGFVSIRIIIAIIGWRSKRKAKSITKALEVANLSPQYSKEEIEEAVRGYVQPDSSVTDPANSSEMAAFSDIRQNIFEVIDNSVTFSKSKQFQLVLADSGMGKTSFCLNYFSHFRTKTGTDGVALVSLASSDADARIMAIQNQSTKVIILDALDEDPKAIINGTQRLYEVLELCRDYRAVIVTCRSQFFANDLAIPQETGVSMLVPRRAGQNSTYHLTRVYLTPFNKNQVTKYINRHFPRWFIINFFQRKRAFKLVDSVTELSSRPMLLELLPELVRSNDDAKELFDLYSFMVNRWLVREARWIEPSKLLAVSKALAVYMHNRHAQGGGDRVTTDELNRIAEDISADKKQWDHLTTRSLLHRDSKGLFKFAHRSIMEYLFVVAAIDGAEECRSHRWTDFMKELFVSWGYTEDGAANLPAAEKLINSDLTITGLFPLSESPSLPTNAPDFASAANRRGQSKSLRRQASPLWRINSVSLKQQGYNVKLTDLEFFKTWLLVDPMELGNEGLMSTYNAPVAKIQSLLDKDNEWRAPSYAEFITLLEATYAAGRNDLLPEGVLFYLGDKIGERRHLLVTVGATPRARDQRGIVLRDKARIINPTNRYTHVYEVGMYTAANSLTTVKAVPLRVANGI